jgi:hypothetical protein
VSNWLLLIHQVPPKPSYLRAKVMRRLTQLGALPLKRSAYLLPASDASHEDLQWLRQEIRAEGGDAWVVEGRFIAGLSDAEIRDKFRALRTPEYAALAADARTTLDRMRSSAAADSTVDADVRRLSRRLSALRRIDFFNADGREEVEALVTTIERLVKTTGQATAPLVGGSLQARTWVTRRGVKVDRMASAWLIRRVIDPAATFLFVAPDAAPPVPDALRFDMFEGEFTHEGDRCTFEVLLEACGRPEDPALAAIAQLVHDIDLGDDKFQRAETAGVAALIDGIVARFDDDHRRLAESAAFFDTLYASLGGGSLTPAREA